MFDNKYYFILKLKSNFDRWPTYLLKNLISYIALIYKIKQYFKRLQNKYSTYVNKIANKKIINNKKAEITLIATTKCNPNTKLSTKT